MMNSGTTEFTSKGGAVVMVTRKRDLEFERWCWPPLFPFLTAEK